MFDHPVKALSIAAALSLAAIGAWAQSATSPQPVTTLGVTPHDAKEATEKATPRVDTGTLVRTEPSVAERARDMTSDAKSSAKPQKATAPKTNSSHRANAAPPVNDPKSQKTTGTVTNSTTPSAAMGITGTVPGATDTTGDATNTRDNAKKGDTSSPSSTAKPMDAMGNRSSGTQSKP